MKRAKIFLALFTIALSCAWFIPGGMSAQDINRAALVVRHDDASVETRCVEFSEAEITGLELLQRSGLDFGVDVQGLGALVCRIDQTGCSTEDCWCQCKGGSDCIYWSYWHQIGSTWQYSQAGAAVYTVGDGAIDGWSWGPGAVNAAFPPPDLSFSDVCTEVTGTENDATPTNSPTAIIFVPQETPAGRSTEVSLAQETTAPPTSTTVATATPDFSASPQPANPTAPAATAVSVYTTMPTSVTTDLTVTSVPTETPPVVVPASLERQRTEPVPTLVVTTDRLSTPVVASTLPTTDVAATAPVGDVNGVEVAQLPAQPALRLTVVGSGVQAQDLRLRKVAVSAEAKVAANANGTSSPLSYATFAAIMLTLTGLFLFSFARRRERQATRGEPRSRS